MGVKQYVANHLIAHTNTPYVLSHRLYVIRSSGTTRKTIHDGINTVLELLTVSRKEKWAVRCNFYRSSVVNVRTCAVHAWHPPPTTGRRYRTRRRPTRLLPGSLPAGRHATRLSRAVVRWLFWCTCRHLNKHTRIVTQQGAPCDGVPRHSRVPVGGPHGCLPATARGISHRGACEMCLSLRV